MCPFRVHSIGPVKQILALALVLLLAALAYWTKPPSGGAATPVASPPPPPGCTCELARTQNGWCAACGVGYVASLEVRSQLVYDALDLHGHDVDLGTLDCSRCREVARADGFCSACGRGFIAGRAYLSPLAYHLVRGEMQAAAPELAVLARALETVERCELCAAAMVIDGTCPECLISYRGGRALPASSERPPAPPAGWSARRAPRPGSR